MTDARVDLGDAAWEEAAPGFRFKRFRTADATVRLVEITPEFVEPDWCLRPHGGYVIEGGLLLEQPDGREMLGAGDGLVIEAGSPHKASVAAGRALLLLVEPPSTD